MSQFWYTNAGRTFVEGTMPKIERHLDRIAKALENMNQLSRYAYGVDPECGLCDHRHPQPGPCWAPVGAGQVCECDGKED